MSRDKRQSPEPGDTINLADGTRFVVTEVRTSMLTTTCEVRFSVIRQDGSRSEHQVSLEQWPATVAATIHLAASSAPKWVLTDAVQSA